MNSSKENRGRLSESESEPKREIDRAIEREKEKATENVPSTIGLCFHRCTSLHSSIDFAAFAVGQRPRVK